MNLFLHHRETYISLNRGNPDNSVIYLLLALYSTHWPKWHKRALFMENVDSMVSVLPVSQRSLGGVEL